MNQNILARVLELLVQKDPMSYPFGKEPNQKKYLSATVQWLEWYATQSFDNIGLVGRVHFDVTPCDM